jgi:prepilin-type N-terminal cleavage/methylation domain-containing protein
VGKNSSVGKTDAGRRGVTLIEMLAVVAIIGIMIAITLPSATAGLDGVRLKSATGEVAAFLNAASNLSQRRQEPVVVTIASKEMTMSGGGVSRHMRLPDGIVMSSGGGQEANSIDREPEGRILLMPGAPEPSTAIELTNQHGVKRTVRLDPMTGFPRVEGDGAK